MRMASGFMRVRNAASTMLRVSAVTGVWMLTMSQVSAISSTLAKRTFSARSSSVESRCRLL